MALYQVNLVIKQRQITFSKRTEHIEIELSKLTKIYNNPLYPVKSV